MCTTVYIFSWQACTVALLHLCFTYFFFQCTADNLQRMERLKRKREEKSKKARIEHKKHRSLEQSKRQVVKIQGYIICWLKTFYSICRKEWVKRQKIVHSYGDDDCLEESDLEEELQQHICDNTVPHHIPAAQDTMPEAVDFVLGGKRCKCGSSTHQRVSHRHCPLRRDNAAPQHTLTTQDTMPKAVHSVQDRKRCKCGSSTHQRTSHRDCPLKKPWM